MTSVNVFWRVYTSSHFFFFFTYLVNVGLLPLSSPNPVPILSGMHSLIVTKCLKTSLLDTTTFGFTFLFTYHFSIFWYLTIWIKSSSILNFIWTQDLHSKKCFFYQFLIDHFKYVTSLKFLSIHNMQFLITVFLWRYYHKYILSDITVHFTFNRTFS